MLINTKEINSKMVRLIAVQHSTRTCMCFPLRHANIPQ